MNNKPSSDNNNQIKRRDFLHILTTATVGCIAVPKVAVARAFSIGEKILDKEVVSYEIYPPIGVSRLGNSHEWFYAPEVPGIPQAQGRFKEDENSIKKQVQRYRIYGFNVHGEAVSEFNLSNCKDIDWQVRVANTKAAWYGFSNPLDLGELDPGIETKKRNSFIENNNERKEKLIIDSGEVSISARKAEIAQLTGNFWDKKLVKLGALDTDSHGRLLIVPGDGVSESIQKNGSIDNFTDNDYWHDDLFDGSVQATITLNSGEIVQATPAWAVSVGPDYSPYTQTFTTLYDTIREVMVNKNLEQPILPPLSFRADIYPLFQRLGQMKWLSLAALQRKAWLDVGDFSDPEFIEKLADNSNSSEVRAFRSKVFDLFREPGQEQADPYKMPYMLGGGVNYPGTGKHWFQMLDTQYQVLKYWDAGLFINDFNDPEMDQRQAIDEFPIADQPEILTRAALNSCSGGAFHPGVELTWVLRHPGLYNGKYRIQLGTRDSLLQDFGSKLSAAEALGTVNPSDKHVESAVGPQMPGDLTRWMGVPWQSDAFSCQTVRYENDFPIVSWWPAKIPIDVLPHSYYEQLLRSDLSEAERIAFANARQSWSRGVAGIGYHAEASYTDGLNNMVKLWSKMGVLTRIEVPHSIPGISDELYVEMARGSMSLGDNKKNSR
ncbi:CTQ-dependent glycine oxidase GoxA [Pelagibaculum spongiae]|uniref:L-lysine 6-oxidase n=1 Tax=Pelagibaculum spongiae TaxID=2080658 RepID=A0A2V1H2R3_9GAMM|nr:CTQ-dependent glycine oxidase GoxA [Pelagibaculum spongiae]PVZ71508.1 hypothetical protein DC094_00200 [Pelagibaculum spongiae]